MWAEIASATAGRVLQYVRSTEYLHTHSTRKHCDEDSDPVNLLNEYLKYISTEVDIGDFKSMLTYKYTMYTFIYFEYTSSILLIQEIP